MKIKPFDVVHTGSNFKKFIFFLFLRESGFNKNILVLETDKSRHLSGSDIVLLNHIIKYEIKIKRSTYSNVNSNLNPNLKRK